MLKVLFLTQQQLTLLEYITHTFFTDINIGKKFK